MLTKDLFEKTFILLATFIVALLVLPNFTSAATVVWEDNFDYEPGETLEDHGWTTVTSGEEMFHKAELSSDGYPGAYSEPNYLHILSEYEQAYALVDTGTNYRLAPSYVIEFEFIALSLPDTAMYMSPEKFFVVYNAQVNIRFDAAPPSVPEGLLIAETGGAPVPIGILTCEVWHHFEITVYPASYQVKIDGVDSGGVYALGGDSQGLSPQASELYFGDFQLATETYGNACWDSMSISTSTPV